MGIKMKQEELTKTFIIIIKPLVFMVCTQIFQRLNPFTAKLFNLNFHPLEVVSR